MNCEPVARHCQQPEREREKKATNRKNPLCYRCWLDVLQWCFDKNNSFGTKVVIFSLTKKGRDPQSQEYTHELLQAVLFGNKCTHISYSMERWAHLCADDSPMDILYTAPTSYKEKTLLSMMKVKLSQERFWPWLETGSSRGFQHCPATYLWVSSRVPFTVDYGYIWISLTPHSAGNSTWNTRTRWNHLDGPVFMAWPRPSLTETCSHPRLDCCAGNPWVPFIYIVVEKLIYAWFFPIHTCSSKQQAGWKYQQQSKPIFKHHI